MRQLRYIIFTLSFFLMGSAVQSQVFNGGVMAGVAGTQVSGDDYSGFHKAGLFLGGFVNLQFSEHSALQMELEFFQKGSRENPDSTNNYQQYLFRLNYVELPVLYQYTAGKRFKFEAGPSLGFLINYYEENNYYEIKGGNPGARVTFQINAGMYVYITRNLLVNIRTNNSLINIRADNATGDVLRIFPGNYGQFNDCLVLSLFYQFDPAW
ncbi:MAG TPA: porin family protein [Bacteroidales bacterium]|nr:porin family protein [Bacteroidales bacterium]HOX78296.1 porin family protein [Bacteroidales bacterium]HPI86561.1 porin family protein [Bacteroidales bacterium]